LATKKRNIHFSGNYVKIGIVTKKEHNVKKLQKLYDVPVFTMATVSGKKNEILMTKTFIIRSKIWIEDQDGKVVFGLGRFRILDAIKRHSSLQAAAKDLKMGYRALWGRIKASEERLGRPLVVRDGRGSKLTPYALELMDQFNEMHTHILDDSNSSFSKFLTKSLE
jgi:molybdate transport system regulatory protein